MVRVHPAKPLVSLVGDVGLELLAIDGLDQFTGLSAFGVLTGGTSKQHIDRRAVAVLTGTLASAQLVVDDQQVTVRWGDDDTALLKLVPRSGDINGQVSDASQDGWKCAGSRCRNVQHDQDRGRQICI
jgi:hypothetical protein